MTSAIEFRGVFVERDACGERLPMQLSTEIANSADVVLTLEKNGEIVVIKDRTGRLS